MTDSTNTITNKEVNAKVEYYRDKSTLDHNDYVHLKIEAPTADEAEQLFTKKLKELKIEP